MENNILKALEKRRSDGTLRRLYTVDLIGKGVISVDGKKYANFSSNDYLGLSSHPEILEALKRPFPAAASSASRLMTGSTRLHEKLEERTASLKGKPSALVFNSGYQANVGIVGALCGRKDIIFADKLVHASLIDGILLSGARHLRFNHNDPEHLMHLISRERGKHENALIVTESVFSMDGDKAPLKDLVRIKDDYDCLLMVDEAHATGVFGREGSGLAEETGTTGGVDILMGTFSKALGGFGAYAAFSSGMRDYLINFCRSFIYSTSLPPSVISGNIAALTLVKDEPFRRRTLLSNAAYLRARLAELGFNSPGDSQIVPLVVGDNTECLEMSDRLRAKGYWVTPVRPPTVPEGSSRIRLSLSYDLGKDVLDGLIMAVRDHLSEEKH